MNPVETYLKELGEIMRTSGGTAEESYYAPLENLLNEIGEKLKPKVRCVQQLTNTGAGEQLHPNLDANYQAVKADVWPWPMEGFRFRPRQNILFRSISSRRIKGESAFF
jgi:hypothetical protein